MNRYNQFWFGQRIASKLSQSMNSLASNLHDFSVIPAAVNISFACRYL